MSERADAAARIDGLQTSNQVRLPYPTALPYPRYRFIYRTISIESQALSAALERTRRELIEARREVRAVTHERKEAEQFCMLDWDTVI